VSTAYQAAATLEGTPWRLVSYAGPDGRLAPVLPTTELTATFREGRVTGETGCNSFIAAYQVSGDSLRISQAVSTRRACLDPAAARQEDAYLQALGRVARFSLSGGELTLRDASGAALLVYAPQPQAPLQGTEWLAEGYNNGRGGVVSVIAGTEITARFIGGRLSGSAGCNTYTGAFTVAGEALTISPLAATRRACISPLGVMEQEAAYLAALPTATRYRVDGRRLTLARDDGARVADFVARSVPSPAALPRTGAGPAEGAGAETESGAAGAVAPLRGAFAAPAALGFLALSAVAWRLRSRRLTRRSLLGG
jgi:heat shock protein HslJ